MPLKVKYLFHVKNVIKIISNYEDIKHNLNKNVKMCFFFQIHLCFFFGVLFQDWEKNRQILALSISYIIFNFEHLQHYIGFSLPTLKQFCANQFCCMSYRCFFGILTTNPENLESFHLQPLRFYMVTQIRCTYTIFSVHRKQYRIKNKSVFK